MWLKIQMASFDSGHTADTAYFPHFGSSNKHFLCQSDWYVLSIPLFYIWKMTSVRGYEFEAVNEFPSYWSICVAGVAGARRRLCQLWLFVSVIRADIELLLFVTALPFWWMAAHCTDPTVPTLSRQPCESAWFCRDYLSLVCSWFSSCKYVGHTCILCRKCPGGCLLIKSKLSMWM